MLFRLVWNLGLVVLSLVDAGFWFICVVGSVSLFEFEGLNCVGWVGIVLCLGVILLVVFV